MKNRNTFALIALGLSLTACGGANRGLESVHQPVVSKADYAFDVSTSANGLDAGDASRLAGWFDAIQLRFGDKVAVDFGGNYDNGAAKASISTVAARYGLLVQETPALTQGDVAPGSARVVVSRLKASVPSCPDWSGTKIETFQNAASANYGCATNSNLAAMIANPEDLIRGVPGSTTTDAETATKAINVFRQAKPTGEQGLKSETTGGK